MRTVRLFLVILAVLMVTSALATDVQAQATRTWVSGVGDDANPCSRTAPCKTFAGAISKTAASGEISALDPGGFGVVTITKAITINGDGTLAGILAAGTNGIIVNAGVNDKVVIRNISINGAGTGINGIRYLAGGQLTVDSVSISGFTTRCIDASLTGNGKLIVLNSTMTNCAVGARLATTAGVFTATLDRTAITNVSSHGLEVAQGTTFATVKGSTISHNGGDGARAGVGSATINLEDTILFNNNIAVNAAANLARIRLSNTTLVNNGTGIAITAGGIVQSAGNNRVDNPAGVAPNATYTVQ